MNIINKLPFHDLMAEFNYIFINEATHTTTNERTKNVLVMN